MHSITLPRSGSSFLSAVVGFFDLFMSAKKTDAHGAICCFLKLQEVLLCIKKQNNPAGAEEKWNNSTKCFSAIQLVDLPSYKSKTIDKRGQYDWRVEKNWTGHRSVNMLTFLN